MTFFDDDWFRAGTDLAVQTPWLHGAVVLLTNYGFVLFGLMWALTFARGERLLVTWAPFAVLGTWLLSRWLKVFIAEPRPCRALAPISTVLPCDRFADFSFPSNHAVLAAASATALLLINRRLGIAAWVLAVLIGLSRVYLGAHYPHDVLAGLVLGGLLPAVILVIRRRAARPVP